MRAAARCQVNERAMPLDPIARKYLDQINALHLRPVEELTPDEARAQMTPAPKPLPDVGSVHNRPIPGPHGEIPLRIYTPWDATPGGGRPLLVFFHGGGWVVGDLETHDGLCRNLANAAGAITIAVDYRRAPEHKYPTAAEDAYTATCWAAAHARELGANPSRLAVAGDSAGGNLAAVVALLARDRHGPPLAGQVLIYPITDCQFETPSYQQFADGHFLTRGAMRWFFEQYLSRPEQRFGPYVSPLRAESLAGLPPALVLTAECDVLRDEAEAYARRLVQAGVSVEQIRCPGMIHGFLRRTDVFPQAHENLAWIGQWLKKMRA
jgi:acetyl esterase